MLTNDQIAMKISNLMWKNAEEDTAAFAVQLFMEHLLLPNDLKSWTVDEIYCAIKDKLDELDSIKGTIAENAAV